MNGASRALRAAGLALAISACATPVGGPVSPIEIQSEVLDALTRYERVYLLQAGDHIEVAVYRHPDFSRKTIIRPDGYISLPLVNDVRAAGRTPRELASHLEELFAQRVKSPEVTVIVENPPEPVVFVVGQVATPRSLPLRQAKTVAQALAQSGDATRAAALSSVSIIRINRSGHLESHTVKVNGFSDVEAYMALQSVALMPNDMVLVPESARSQIVRFMQDFVTVLTPYFQIRILEEIE